MKKLATALFMLLCVLGSILCIRDYKSKDHVPPIITLNNQNLTYQDLMDEKKQLMNVTAFDDVDGDVTDSLIIEGIYPNAAETIFRVIYVAEDSAGNVAKEECLVKRDVNEFNMEDFSQGIIPTIATKALDENGNEHDLFKTAISYDEFIANTWDRFLVEHSNITTKTNMGLDSSGSYSIYKYEITPENYSKTIFLTAGAHGSECEGFWGLYRLIYDVFDGSNGDFSVEALKNVRFIIVPVWNPWGMMNVDTEGSDMGRNCVLGVQPYLDFSSSNVNGPETKEARIIMDIEEEYRDTSGNSTIDYYADFHTDPITPSKGCYGYSMENSKTRPIVVGASTQFSQYISERYEVKFDMFDGIIEEKEEPSIAMHYMEKKHDIPANVFEIAVGGFSATQSEATINVTKEWYGFVLTYMMQMLLFTVFRASFASFSCFT